MKRQIESWIHTGMCFGYPICCIADFIWNIQSGEYKTRKKRKFDGTGYVPCKACNRLPKHIILAQIQELRGCELPFPQDDV
jgi:hypothetical protein